MLFSLACRLSSCCLPTTIQPYLAEIHCDLHALLAGAGQPSTEQTTYFIDALLQDDYQGREAVAIYIRAHLLIMAARTFVDLVTTVILHAPTIVVTPVSLDYPNALSTVSVASASSAESLDEVGLAQFISKSQRDLAALCRKMVPFLPLTAIPPPRNPSGGPLVYYYKHGYQRSHQLGSDCKVLKGSPHLYTAQHRAATDHLTPAGGNLHSTN